MTKTNAFDLTITLRGLDSLLAAMIDFPVPHVFAAIVESCYYFQFYKEILFCFELVLHFHLSPFAVVAY